MGDEQARVAFEELFETTYRHVFAYCRRRTSKPEDAEDALEETYLTAWRRIEEAVSAEVPLAWLYGVARRVLANQRRSADRRDQLVARLKQDPGSVPTDLTSLVEAAEALDAAKLALSSLSASDRELLQLVAFERLSYREISLVLGTTMTVIRTRLYRARHRLQAAFERIYQMEEAI